MMDRFQDWNTGSGKFEHLFKQFGKFEIHCDSEFTVYLSNSDTGELIPIGPKSSTDRHFVYDVMPGYLVQVVTSGLWSWIFEVGAVAEPGGGPKLVEHIPAEEMSIYDRLRAEMLEKLSELAGERGYDTLDDEEDLDFDDPDFDVPFTPYEAVEMDEEEPVSHANPDNAPSSPSDGDVQPEPGVGTNDPATDPAKPAPKGAE